MDSYGLATQLEHSERLAALMQSVGFAVWQLQELETTVATYMALRLHVHPGIGRSQGEAILKAAEGRTLGSLLRELAKSGIIEDQLASDLEELLGDRNWLVHRARRENRGVIANPQHLNQLLNRLQRIAGRAFEFHKSLATDLELHLLNAGVDRAVIDREAERLAQSWGLLS